MREEPRHLLGSLVAHRLEPRLRRRPPASSVTGSAGFGRDHLGDAVDLAVGHLQHAADVAEHGARLRAFRR